MITNEELLQRVEDLEAQMQQVRDGSIVEHITEAIHWKATTKTFTGGTDYTADGAWTDLDLNKWTSDKAKYAILLLQHDDGCTVGDDLSVRKNGETPAARSQNMAQVSAKWCNMFCIVAMDADQVIEYYATDASDTYIYVLGYIE